MRLFISVDGHIERYSVALTLTVPRMRERQMGQVRSCREQVLQQTKWPHGRNTVSICRSMQTRQTCSSFSRRFSASSNNSSSPDVHKTACSAISVLELSMSLTYRFHVEWWLNARDVEFGRGVHLCTCRGIGCVTTRGKSVNTRVYHQAV